MENSIARRLLLRYDMTLLGQILYVYVCIYVCKYVWMYACIMHSIRLIVQTPLVYQGVKDKYIATVECLDSRAVISIDQVCISMSLHIHIMHAFLCQH